MSKHSTIVGWSHIPFGKREEPDVESLMGRVSLSSNDGVTHAGQADIPDGHCPGQVKFHCTASDGQLSGTTITSGEVINLCTEPRAELTLSCNDIRYNPTAPGDFYAPHDICADSRGDVYVTEVTWSAGASRGLVTPDCHSLQKFTLGSDK